MRTGKTAEELRKFLEMSDNPKVEISKYLKPYAKICKAYANLFLYQSDVKSLDNLRSVLKVSDVFIEGNNIQRIGDQVGDVIDYFDFSISWGCY